MSGEEIQPTDSLPDAAKLIMTTETVFRISGKGTFVAGVVECEELRPGDHILAVAENCSSPGRVWSVQQFSRMLEVARRGDQVSLLIANLGNFPVRSRTQLYLVPKSGSTSPEVKEGI